MKTRERDLYEKVSTKNESWVQGIAGGMVSNNIENGLSVTYNSVNKKLDFNVDNPTITISGAVSGSETINNLSDTTINVSSNMIAIPPLNFSSDTLSIEKADLSTNGFLHGYDWGVFNSKQDANAYLEAINQYLSKESIVKFANISTPVINLDGLNLTEISGRLHWGGIPISGGMTGNIDLTTATTIIVENGLITGWS